MFKRYSFFITLFWLLFLVMVGKTFAQNFQTVKSIDAKNVWHITTDKLGNLYVADDKVISKYDKDGNFLCSYSNYDFLNFRFIDATDPFKLMLFSSEFQTIRMLDSYFGTSGEINLSYYPDMGLPYLACATDDGNYWIYDRQNNLLRKIDTRGNVQITSSNLFLLSERNYIPSSLQCAGDWIVMNNEQEDLLLFDRFGSYFKGIRIDSSYFQQATDKQLFLIKNDTLIAFDFIRMTQKRVVTPPLFDVMAIRIEQNRMYLLRQDAIEIVSFE